MNLAMDILNQRLLTLSGMLEEGTVEIYSGPRPVEIGGSPGEGNSLIGEFETPFPFHQYVSLGVMTITPIDISESLALATTEDMQWARFYSSGEDFVMDVGLSVSPTYNGLIVRSLSAAEDGPLFLNEADGPALVIIGTIRAGGGI